MSARSWTLSSDLFRAIAIRFIEKITNRVLIILHKLSENQVAHHIYIFVTKNTDLPYAFADILRNVADNARMKKN